MIMNIEVSNILDLEVCMDDLIFPTPPQNKTKQNKKKKQQTGQIMQGINLDKGKLKAIIWNSNRISIKLPKFDDTNRKDAINWVNRMEIGDENGMKERKCIGLSFILLLNYSSVGFMFLCDHPYFDEVIHKALTF